MSTSQIGLIAATVVAEVGCQMTRQKRALVTGVILTALAAGMVLLLTLQGGIVSGVAAVLAIAVLLTCATHYPYENGDKT